MTQVIYVITGFAFFVVIAAAFCSLRSQDFGDNSVDCVENQGKWHSPEWITPGWCER